MTELRLVLRLAVLCADCSWSEFWTNYLPGSGVQKICHWDHASLASLLKMYYYTTTTSGAFWAKEEKWSDDLISNRRRNSCAVTNSWSDFNAKMEHRMALLSFQNSLSWRNDCYARLCLCTIWTKQKKHLCHTYTTHPSTTYFTSIIILIAILEYMHPSCLVYVTSEYISTYLHTVDCSYYILCTCVL